jgi:DNA-directed RNA polymerase subunit E'/Rpb7
MMCADCGPQERILVPKKNMSGFEYRQEEVETYNSWRDSTGSEIKMNEVVRLQIVATKWDAKDRTYLAVGSLNGDLLGHLPDYGKEDSMA